MQLTINGQSKEVQSSNLEGIVSQFCKNSKNIIAELNGQIIPSSNWSQTQIKNNDTIELVSFVGGG